MIINSDTFLVLVDAVVDSSLLKFHFSEVTLIFSWGSFFLTVMLISWAYNNGVLDDSQPNSYCIFTRLNVIAE